MADTGVLLRAQVGPADRAGFEGTREDVFSWLTTQIGKDWVLGSGEGTARPRNPAGLYEHVVKEGGECLVWKSRGIAASDPTGDRAVGTVSLVSRYVVSAQGRTVSVLKLSAAAEVVCDTGGKVTRDVEGMPSASPGLSARERAELEREIAEVRRRRYHS